MTLENAIVLYMHFLSFFLFNKIIGVFVDGSGAARFGMGLELMF